jgi:hypothetical protein
VLTSEALKGRSVLICSSGEVEGFGCYVTPHLRDNAFRPMSIKGDSYDRRADRA